MARTGSTLGAFLLSTLVVPSGTVAQAHLVSAGLAPAPSGEIYYEAVGAGEPIVLIHGNAGDLRHWDRQVGALAERFRVIRYDVRGFGRSSDPVENGTYSNFGDVVAVLDHLDISRAHVMGWSMGSGIAFDFALTHPERTLSVISVGPWIGGYSSEATRAMFRDMGPVRRAGREGGSVAAVSAWMSAPFFATTIQEPEAGEFFRYVASGQSFLPSEIENPRTSLSPSAYSRIEELEAPLLIVTAEHDIPACIETADALEQAVTSAVRVTMSETGHLMHIERPDEFNSIVLDFLTSAEHR